MVAPTKVAGVTLLACVALVLVCFRDGRSGAVVKESDEPDVSEDDKKALVEWAKQAAGDLKPVIEQQTTAETAEATGVTPTAAPTAAVTADRHLHELKDKLQSEEERNARLKKYLDAASSADPVDAIQRARQQKEAAIAAQKAAQAAKGVASLVSAKADKLLATVSAADHKWEASRTASEAEAAKETEQAQAETAAARTQMAAAVEAIAAAKKEATKAKQVVTRFLSPAEVTNAKRMYAQKQRILESAFGKAYGAAPAPPSTSSLQAAQIGELAAKEVVESTFGTVGQ